MGLRLTNMSPRLGAAPQKLKPGTAKTPKTSELFMMAALARAATLEVYSSEAASGACTSTMKYPWSSSGTKLVGTDL